MQVVRALWWTCTVLAMPLLAGCNSDGAAATGATVTSTQAGESADVAAAGDATVLLPSDRAALNAAAVTSPVTAPVAAPVAAPVTVPVSAGAAAGSTPNAAAIVASLNGVTTAAALAAVPPATTYAISGTPSSVAIAGQVYRFMPTVTGPAGASYRFSIINKPSWAVFVPSTGLLMGWPNASSYDWGHIVISVSDGTTVASLPAFPIFVYSVGDLLQGVQQSGAGSASLSWQAPVSNTDGTPLDDLRGYRIYAGKDAGALIQALELGAAATSFTITDLPPGTYFFAVKAFNSANVESDLSAIVRKTI